MVLMKISYSASQETFQENCPLPILCRLSKYVTFFLKQHFLINNPNMNKIKAIFYLFLIFFSEQLIFYLYHFGSIFYPNVVLQLVYSWPIFQLFINCRSKNGIFYLFNYNHRSKNNLKFHLSSIDNEIFRNLFIVGYLQNDIVQLAFQYYFLLFRIHFLLH